MTQRYHSLRIVLIAFVALALSSVAGTAFAAITALTVHDRGTLVNDKTGAVVSGQIQCGAGEFVSLNVVVAQSLNGHQVTSSGNGSFINCTGALQTWQVTLQSFQGWKNGPAVATVEAFSCCSPFLRTGATIHLGNK